jgi:hypothetical protein
MHIGTGTSAEVAIKLAFDFGKVLRSGGAEEGDYDRQRLIWVDQRYATHPMMSYIVAGFEAGYLNKALPWVRQIDAATLANAIKPPEVGKDGSPLP